MRVLERRESKIADETIALRAGCKQRFQFARSVGTQFVGKLANFE